jgi:hypothetical protein
MPNSYKRDTKNQYFCVQIVKFITDIFSFTSDHPDSISVSVLKWAIKIFGFLINIEDVARSLCRISLVYCYAF